MAVIMPCMVDLHLSNSRLPSPLRVYKHTLVVVKRKGLL